MATAPAFLVRANDGEAIDALVWRALGRTAGAVEAVLEANPGLAALGPLLPQGQVVTMPALPAGPAVVPLLQLWD